MFWLGILLVLILLAIVERRLLQALLLAGGVLTCVVVVIGVVAFGMTEPTTQTLALHKLADVIGSLGAK